MCLGILLIICFSVALYFLALLVLMIARIILGVIYCALNIAAIGFIALIFLLFVQIIL